MLVAGAALAGCGSHASDSASNALKSWVQTVERPDIHLMNQDTASYLLLSPGTRATLAQEKRYAYAIRRGFETDTRLLRQSPPPDASLRHPWRNVLVADRYFYTISAEQLLARTYPQQHVYALRLRDLTLLQVTLSSRLEAKLQSLGVQS